MRCAQSAFAACFSVFCSSVSNCRQKYTEDLILILLRYFAHLHQVIEKKSIFLCCLPISLRGLNTAGCPSFCPRGGNALGGAAMFSPALRAGLRAYAAPSALCSPCLRQVRAYARFFFIGHRQCADLIARLMRTLRSDGKIICARRSSEV